MAYIININSYITTINLRGGVKMEDYKYSAIIDCEILERVQRFESNDFISFELNMKTLEELLSQLKVTYSICLLH